MIFIILIQLYSISTLDLKYIQNEQALCLDGSRSSYYYQKGFNEGQNKFIIHFEGADLILGISEDEYFKNAISKLDTIYGSSINRQLSIQYEGLLSQDKNQNQYFHNWNIIHINSCDGTGYQGYSQDPLIYENKTVYFRGDIIVKSILKEFQYSLIYADTILLTGCSTGAIASLLWSDYIYQLIPSQTYLLCIPDSGIFLDMNTIEGTELLKQSLKIMNYVVNKQINIPNHKCANDFPNQIWKCFYLANLLQYIDTPIFIIQSLYDISFLYNYLKISCIKDFTLVNCSRLENQYIKAAYSQFHTTVKNYIINKPTSGSFAPSCISNCFFLNDVSFSNQWSIPEQTNNTIYHTLMKWIQFQINGQINFKEIALIDEVQWPNNQGCAKTYLSTQIIKLLNYFFIFYILN